VFFCGMNGRRRQFIPRREVFRGPQAPEPPLMKTLQLPCRYIAVLGRLYLTV
jgi:hypothetical protein